MRILHIVSSMSPEGGGPQEAVRMIVHYAPAGYESEVATLDAPDEPFLARMPFPVHALGVRKPGAAKSSWYSPKLIPWLRANRSRFDGVMLHGLWEFTGIATLAAVAGHKPYVVFPHGMLDPYFKRAFPAKHLKKWIYWVPIEYWILRRALRVLFTTGLEANLARQSFWLHRWQPMVVALGADPPANLEAIASDAFFAACPELAANGAKRFLLYLGRIDPKKGCDLLIRAFAAVAERDPGLHLVMAGPDLVHWREQLQTEATRAGVAVRIHWPGMLTGEAKWGAFKAAEAFVLPSHQENFGIAVAEALACGTPVLVSTQINIAPDLAADGCALVEPDTLEGTGQLLSRWIDLPDEERRAMSMRAHQTFLRRYQMRRNAETILRVFEPSAALAAGVPAEAKP